VIFPKNNSENFFGFRAPDDVCNFSIS